MKITHYMIVGDIQKAGVGRGQDHYSVSMTLEQSVNEKIRIGWQPLGGPFVYKDNRYQAMVKYES